MTGSTRSASNILLQLSSSTAILMTLSGLLFLIGTHLLSVHSGSQRFIGEIDVISVALIFGGIAVALKTIEIRLRVEQDLSID
jgi:hypothetical protein